MKAGDVSVVQYDTEHGGTRVMPLRSAADIARLEALSGGSPSWVVVGYAADEGDAHAKQKVFKKDLKKNTSPQNTQKDADGNAGSERRGA